MVQADVVLALMALVGFYRIGEMEEGLGLAWAALSVLASCFVVYVFGGGWIVISLAQAALFIGVAVYRVWRESP